MLEVHSSPWKLADHSVFSIRKTEKYEFYIAPVSDTLITIVSNLKGTGHEMSVCKTPDLPFTVRQATEIDFCATCYGVWLDRGEHNKEKSRCPRRGPISVGRACRTGCTSCIEKPTLLTEECDGHRGASIE
jgi:hypothetical protein